MTELNLSQIRNFLLKKYPNVGEIVAINRGESSKAFSFTTGKDELIIRINESRYGFDKDAFSHKNFSMKLPIPRILEIGDFSEELYYSISECAKGVRMDLLSVEERESAVEDLFRVLDFLHSIDPIGDAYGELDSVGVGESISWAEKITDDHNDPENWEKAAKAYPMLVEVDFFKMLNRKLLELVEVLPEERKLVHGDFGFDNLFILDSKVSAIIDWSQSMYGDPLYDVAWLNFWNWQDSINYSEEYKKRHPKINNYDERILAYMIDIGLGALYFFAERKNQKSYDGTFRLLKEKLKLIV